MKEKVNNTGRTKTLSSGINLQPCVSDNRREGSLWKGMLTSVLTLARTGDEPPKGPQLPVSLYYPKFYLNLT